MVAGVDVMAGKALAAFELLLGDRSAWSLQRVWMDDFFNTSGRRWCLGSTIHKMLRVTNVFVSFI